MPDTYHLLGDKAYPSRVNLLTPFRDNGHLTRQQILFNNRLSKARSAVERAFGILKGKFRRLKYLDMNRIELIPTIIIACCVLHNISRREQYEYEEFEIEEGDDDNDQDNDDDPPTQLASSKRFAIMQSLSTRR